MTQKVILNYVEDQNLLKKLATMRFDQRKRDNSKYCRFYKDHKHNTKECFELKKEIKNLIRKGWLRAAR